MVQKTFDVLKYSSAFIRDNSYPTLIDKYSFFDKVSTKKLLLCVNQKMIPSCGSIKTEGSI